MTIFTGSLIDHIELGVSDSQASKAFYQRVLEPLGISCVQERPRGEGDTDGQRIGFGTGVNPFFWFNDGLPQVPPRQHVAFVARDRGAVEGFHAAGLAAGGKDNGAPGIRSKYHPAYYAAFILDPDGINVEAVFHHDTVEGVVRTAAAKVTSTARKALGGSDEESGDADRGRAA